MNSEDSRRKMIDEIAEKCGYWEGHPDHPISDWQYLVANNDTRLGYWEWVASQLIFKGEHHGPGD